MLEDTGCAGACFERASDWFERELPNLGMVSSVSAMVRADLSEDFLATLDLEPRVEAVVRQRIEVIVNEPIVPRDEL